MFYQTFISQQVNRNVIISNQHDMYGSPQKLLNDLRLTNLGCQDILEKYQNFIQL